MEEIIISGIVCFVLSLLLYIGGVPLGLCALFFILSFMFVIILLRSGKEYNYSTTPIIIDYSTAPVVVHEVTPQSPIINHRIDSVSTSTFIDEHRHIPSVDHTSQITTISGDTSCHFDGTSSSDTSFCSDDTLF